MGLATIDPHNQKEHTEIHKIPKFGVNRASFDGKVQNMDPWSMDPLRGPGPRTGSIKIWTESMDPQFLLPLKLLK